MVKVATSLDVPIKLLWPKSMAFAAERGFTMLGLGDVVIPGIFIALALRYDHHRAGAPGHRAFRKPYFYAGLGAYVAGLATTMGVMGCGDIKRNTRADNAQARLWKGAAGTAVSEPGMHWGICGDRGDARGTGS